MPRHHHRSKKHKKHHRRSSSRSGSSRDWRRGQSPCYGCPKRKAVSLGCKGYGNCVGLRGVPARNNNPNPYNDYTLQLYYGMGFPMGSRIFMNRPRGRYQKRRYRHHEGGDLYDRQTIRNGPAGYTYNNSRF